MPPPLTFPALRPLLRSAHFRFLALIVVIELCLVGAMLVVVSQELHSAVDARDESVASQRLADLIDDARDMTLPRFRHDLLARLRSPSNRGDIIALADRDNRIVAGNVTQWPAALDRGGSVRWLIIRVPGAAEERRYAIAVQPVYGSYRLLVGHTNQRSDALRESITDAALTSLLIALPLALLGAWLAVRVIEGRVERIDATAAAVAAGRLSDRVPLDGSGDSFDKLGARVNQMLDRIGALVEELRVLSDSLAHDLRSPIMRLRARIDHAITGDHRDADWPEVLASVSLEAERLHLMLSNALEISRAEAGLARRQMAMQDLSLLMADIADLYEPLVEEHGRALHLDTPAPCMALVHREMLTMAISNLIDNALKYGAGTITASVRREGDEAIITIADQGDGFAPDQEQVALSRFGRLDNARSKEGAGLGLALVESTVRMHGGALRFDRRDGAFHIRAAIPAAPDG
ncbi:HAMP domain-containing histidine kinase [Sphingobium sufflavum]|uniref:sensor histidine kinase n=1 Tax=Sphingobium sufflavum TaxID=1129547 RepID=UPI001F290EAD|nr:ATP-binding protein [Sphingobium sufflavum]MCE7795399.1 HAMP domain-containing histidine kinase [Sphingobium sufflavum]